MEITLNSNEGISQAILRELKSEGVLTSNMDKEAWTNIFDEFKNDQESKINDTKVGEAWDDFYRKYNTNKDDKLNIAEATWNKIKEFAEAFKQRKGEKAENTEAAQNTNQTGETQTAQAGKTQQAAPSKTKAPAAPKRRKAHLRSTNCKGVWYEPATGKHYREVGQNQPVVEIQSIGKDYVITQFNKDGGHWERSKTQDGYGDYQHVLYDTKGNIKQYAYKSAKTGKLTYREYYDKNGKSVSESYDNNGKLTYKSFYVKDSYHYEEYNKDGSINKKKSCYYIKRKKPDQTVVTERWYYSGGMEIVE